MKQLRCLMILVLPVIFGNVSANQDIETKQLLSRIQAMEERLAVLEGRVTFSAFMPDFAERFHVMHRASGAGDWAVASHELEVMKEIIASSKSVDVDKGTLFQAMMGPVVEKMDDAIKHANQEKMNASLSEAVQACNSCHVATGSPFIKVTLDATESLSMRHPHQLSKQKVGKHGH